MSGGGTAAATHAAATLAAQYLSLHFFLMFSLDMEIRMDII